MIPAAAGALTLLLHLATAWRYGYFRDELYFIACAKHLAWGYVDQPPLVAVAAWLASPFGYSLVALRLLPALSAALTAMLAARITSELGGKRFAQVLSGVSVGLLPAYLTLGNILTTTSFEGLSWTLATYCTLRIVRAPVHFERPTPWWIALAFSIAFGLYGKYSMGLLATALLIGLLVTRERRALVTPDLVVAAALTGALVLPNLLWQSGHGWPFLEVIRGDFTHRHPLNDGIALESRNIAANAVAFAVEQFVYTNPFSAPVWLAGLVAPFFTRRMRALRFLSVAYGLLLLAAVLLEAKGYYVIGVYASLLAVGAVVVERAAQPVRAGIFALLAVVAIVSLPLSLPVLPIRTFVSYTAALGMTGRNGSTAHLVQPIYAEEFGWDRLARDVASVYEGLPEDIRDQSAIYADTYADAAAIDFFGPRYGLPRAIGSQNTYWLWGTHGYDGSTLIAIGATRIARLERFYRSCRLVRTSTEPLKWVVEGPDPIYLCSEPTMPFSAIWPNLRWYGA
jgi:hypothetical protein